MTILRDASPPEISTMNRGQPIQTFTGRAYYPMAPRPNDLEIEDVAHALSNLCRWGGHVKRFYSVAEHSVHVSRCVPPNHAFAALMHDATEAYVIDVPRPLKRALVNYADIEIANWRAICDRWSMCFDLPQCVHDADNKVLMAERLALMRPSFIGGWPDIEAANVEIIGWAPVRAKQEFLMRFEQLLEDQAASP